MKTQMPRKGRKERTVNSPASKYATTAVRMDQAMLALLQKKTFEEISVSELCKEAGVNRSTFYQHYRNTSELLEEATSYLVDDFLTYFPFDLQKDEIDFAACDLNELNFVCDKYLIPYLTYVKEHKEVFTACREHAVTLKLEEVYGRMFKRLFDPIMERFHYPREARHYAIRYYLTGINAINMEWVREGCKTPVEDVARIIRSCVLGFQHTEDLKSL